MLKQKNNNIIWGVELSPFVLKLQACLQYTGRPYRRLPDQGSYLENTRVMLALEYAKQHKLVTRFPKIDSLLDEYPAVPFFSQDGRHFQYDSSSIAHWMDASTTQAEEKLFPNQAVLKFVAKLIDEAFDEFGLYLVHHMRWVASAKSNQMGKLLSKEFRKALPPGGKWYLSKSFPKRQVRRCPYLFSVAPIGYRSGMSKHLNPPSCTGFPETHTLINESWQQYLKGMETVLTNQAYLLGESFTIADASAYGQLAMNLVDPEAAEKMQQLAPTTFKWLNKIYHKEHLHDKLSNLSRHNKPFYFNDHLVPLLNTIMSTYSTLMVQNSNAYEQALLRGETLFNEAAFDEGRALYNGKLRGYPFRSVVKTFQVRTWRTLCTDWRNLPEEHKAQLRENIELCDLFEM